MEPQHGIVTEAVLWAEHDSRFRRDFEDLVAWVARELNKTAVKNPLRIAWATVGNIIERVVAGRNMNMCPSYVLETKARASQADIAFEPFDVVKLANDAVQVRRTEARERKGSEEAGARSPALPEAWPNAPLVPGRRFSQRSGRGSRRRRRV